MKKLIFFILCPLFVFSEDVNITQEYLIIKFNVDKSLETEFEEAKILLTNTNGRNKGNIEEFYGKDFLNKDSLIVWKSQDIFILFSEGSSYRISSNSLKEHRNESIVSIDIAPDIRLPKELKLKEAGVNDPKETITIKKLDNVPKHIKDISNRILTLSDQEQSIEFIKATPPPLVSIKANYYLNPFFPGVDQALIRKLSNSNFACGVEYSPNVYFSRKKVKTLTFGFSLEYLDELQSCGDNVDLLLAGAYIGNYFKTVYYHGNYFLIMPKIGYYFLNEHGFSEATNNKKWEWSKIDNITAGITIFFEGIRKFNWHLDFNYYRTNGYNKSEYSIFLAGVGIRYNWLKKDGN
jgi:hypothetical protein